MAKKEKPIDVPFAVASGNKTAITVLGVVCFFLLLSTLAFAVVAAKMYSKKEKVPEPIIFEVDRTAHKVVKIERGGLGQDKQSLLRSVSLRSYVEWRETINHIDEKDRWKKVKLMSSRDVYKTFYDLLNPAVNEDSVFADSRFKRKIQIITDYPISTGNRNIHRVEYYATDFINGKEYPTQRYVAVIQYVSDESYVSYEDRFVNIDGLIIVRYEIYGA